VGVTGDGAVRRGLSAVGVAGLAVAAAGAATAGGSLKAERAVQPVTATAAANMMAVMIRTGRMAASP
jgi:hypothetical protein